MSRHTPHRIAHTDPVFIDIFSHWTRMAVYDQGRDAPLVAVKEVHTGPPAPYGSGPTADAEWTRGPGGDVCPLRGTVVSEESNARIHRVVAEGGES